MQESQNLVGGVLTGAEIGRKGKKGKKANLEKEYIWKEKDFNK